MARSKSSGLSVAVVHESKIDELIRVFANFSFLKNLNISEDNSILWDMKGKDGYCIQVMFIGKTGYGKSTTLNKICGKELFKTDDIKSCTKTVFSAEYKIKSAKNYFFSLCDLPGMGETIADDKTYARYYAEMLVRSHCVIYIMRADQRDYSEDQEILRPMLESKVQKKKIMLAVNYADKIEPVSHSSPFNLNKQQKENIEKKISEIQKLFKIPKTRIVFYSAKDGYNLDAVAKGITDILKTTVRREPTHRERVEAIYKMTSQDNCGECGCTNCMQFAMQAASPNNSIEWNDCSYINEEEAEEFFASLDDDSDDEENIDDDTDTVKQKRKKPVYQERQEMVNNFLGGMLGFMGELAKKYPK